MAAGPVVEVIDASKRYADVLAVDRVSLRVEAGEIYALLGLNGAGKSTLIRLMLGMIRPTGGQVSLFGRIVNLREHDVWSRVGYLVETPAAYPELTVRENLNLVRGLRHVVDRTAVDDVIDRLGLNAYADRRARTLSLGNAQRLGLAKALLHQPRLLILDEPANGLDPAGVVEVRDLLQDLTAQGATVFLSSHVLAEVARLATRIGIIHSGQLRQELDTTNLADLVRRSLRITTRDHGAATDILATAGYPVSVDGNSLVTHDRRAVDAPDDIAVLLVQGGSPPTHLAVEHEDLEGYFLRAVGADHA
ncbi:MAG: ABC transporter ATP-binding protein [Micromonosporaceae bacterium]